MPVDQGTVIGAVASAAGATAGFNLGFIALLAGLLSVKSELHSTLKVFTGIAILAFALSVAAGLLAFIWLAVTVSDPAMPQLGLIYGVSVWAVLLSTATFFVTFVVFGWMFLTSDVFETVAGRLRTLVTGSP